MTLTIDRDHQTRDETPGHVVVTVRPVATPLSLGFLALAVASFVLSGLELSWVPAAQSHLVGLVLVTFAAPLQLGSAVFGFLTRDPVAAAGTAVLGGTWLAVGTTLNTLPRGATSPALGLLLVASAAVLLVPAVAGVASKLLAAGVLAVAAARFAAAGGYELSGSPGWKTASGIAGLVVAGVALYGALAFEVEGAYRRTILPIGRRRRGKVALNGDFPDEVAGVEHEPGVRQQL